jgi:hypothetical protein
MDEKEFWKTTLMPHFGDNCIAHFIVPTCLKKINKDIKNQKDPKSMITSYLNFQCVFCKEPTMDTSTRMALRCIIARKHLTGNAYLHDINVSLTCICEKCEAQKKYPPALNSSKKNIKILLDDLDKIITKFVLNNFNDKLTASQIWEQITCSFDEFHSQRMKKLLCLDPTCATCFNKTATKFCGGCLCVIYCDRACSQKDWTNHKGLCKMLQSFKFLLNNEIHNLDF